MDNESNWTNPPKTYVDENGNIKPNPNYANPQMGPMAFVDAIKVCFEKYANFNGRAPRAEFWWWMLFCFILNCIPFLNFVTWAIVLIPTLAVCWRRLHDIGKGGGYYFVSWIPIVGWIFSLIWYCTPGQSGPNRFGPNPYNE